MVEPLRHRQTKGAGTDMLSLTSPRHTSTLPKPVALARRQAARFHLGLRFIGKTLAVVVLGPIGLGVVRLEKRSQCERHARRTVRVARREHEPRRVRLLGRDHCRRRAALPLFPARSGWPLRSRNTARAGDPLFASAQGALVFLYRAQRRHFGAQFRDHGL
jgi:hypothetical protein